MIWSLTGKKRTSACMMAFMSILTANAAFGMEKFSPMLPGVTTGVPAGALPPDGWYFNLSVFPQNGSLKDGSGNNAFIPAPGVGQPKVSNLGVSPQVMWVPGVEFLGARYAAMITQPFNYLDTSFSGGNPSSTNYAMFNTILTPLMLSWKLGQGWFFGSGMSVYLKNGTFTSTYNPYAFNGTGLGREQVANNSYANNFWTFEPNFALSYLGNDWNITLNNTFNFNTKNFTTGYTSGSTYYLDTTVAKNFGPWQFGVIGNYTQQFENDTINGVVVPATPNVNSRGSKIQHVKIGPLIAYTFENHMTLSARYLQAVHTENDQSVSIFWLTLATPLAALNPPARANGLITK